jgi:hypothetical protein
METKSGKTSMLFGSISKSKAYVMVNVVAMNSFKLRYSEEFPEFPHP